MIGEEATGFFEDHLKTILAVVGVMVLAAVGWVVFDKSRAAKETTAQHQLAVIAAVYPGQGGPVPPDTIRQAVEKYQAFLKGNPPGAAAHIARLNLGRAHEDLGDTAAAQAAYRAAAAGPPALAGVATMRLAYASAAAGDSAAATEAFGRVVGGYPGLAPQAALEMARLAEQTGAAAVAIDHYQKIVTAYSNSPQAEDAKNRIRVLGGTVPGDAAASEAAPAPAPAAPAAQSAPPGG